MYTFSSGNLFLWKCGNLFSVEIRETSWIISYTFDVTLQEVYLGVTYCFHFLQRFMRNFPSAFRVLAVPLRNMLTPRKNYTTNQMINWCYFLIPIHTHLFRFYRTKQIARLPITTTPSFLVYKTHTHIKIQTFISLTNNLTINF